ncbi:hypothetical protein ACFLZB_02835 [Nanoarchaeota archaeon]
MPKGRPPQSSIRQNIMEILFYLPQGYGYQIGKIYNSIFPKATLRVIYYHLKKGCDLEEFKVKKVEFEKGDYSWGPTAQKTYYSLGKKAQPQGLKHVKAFLEKKN